MGRSTLRDAAPESSVRELSGCSLKVNPEGIKKDAWSIFSNKKIVTKEIMKLI